MPLRAHIVDLDTRGWSLYHTLGCPGNLLLKCPVTEACRDLKSAPSEGRFECDYRSRGDHYELVLGNALDPLAPVHTARRTGHGYQASRERPQ